MVAKEIESMYIFHCMNELKGQPKGLKVFLWCKIKYYIILKEVIIFSLFVFKKLTAKRQHCGELETFAVKAMVAWHMRIFCCKTFFGQNSHINFIEPLPLPRTSDAIKTKGNIFKFNSKCL